MDAISLHCLSLALPFPTYLFFPVHGTPVVSVLSDLVLNKCTRESLQRSINCLLYDRKQCGLINVPNASVLSWSADKTFIQNTDQFTQKILEPDRQHLKG